MKQNQIIFRTIFYDSDSDKINWIIIKNWLTAKFIYLVYGVCRAESIWNIWFICYAVLWRHSFIDPSTTTLKFHSLIKRSFILMRIISSEGNFIVCSSLPVTISSDRHTFHLLLICLISSQPCLFFCPHQLSFHALAILTIVLFFSYVLCLLPLILWHHLFVCPLCIILNL